MNEVRLFVFGTFAVRLFEFDCSIVSLFDCYVDSCIITIGQLNN